MLTENYVVDGLLPTSENPPSLKLSGVTFDASKHLQIELPNTVKNLQFEELSFPFSPNTPLTGGLSYTKPFRILSDEGVKAARMSLEENVKLLGKSNNRASKYVRGLGYVSNFHRGLAYCPEILALLSSMSGDDVFPHSMSMNISHTNIGEINTGRPVDKWHVDSVDYVLIIMLSDLTDMVGGELRVLQQPNDSTGGFFAQLARDGIPSHIPIETVNYIAAGYGIFMQGSKIFHTVNGVLAAREPRISLVNSYMTRRPFATDLTRYSTFADGLDGRDIVNLEYARHKAWRVHGQMQYVMDEVGFEAGPEELSRLMEGAAHELLHTAQLLRGEINDNAKWIDEPEQSAAREEKQQQQQQT